MKLKIISLYMLLAIVGLATFAIPMIAATSSDNEIKHYQQQLDKDSSYKRESKQINDTEFTVYQHAELLNTIHSQESKHKEELFKRKDDAIAYVFISQPSKLVVEFSALEFFPDSQAIQAIVAELAVAPSATAGRRTYFVGGGTVFNNNWGLANYYPIDRSPQGATTDHELPETKLILLRKVGSNWTTALEGSAAFRELLQDQSLDLFSEQTRQVLMGNYVP